MPSQHGSGRNHGPAPLHRHQPIHVLEAPAVTGTPWGPRPALAGQAGIEDLTPGLPGGQLAAQAFLLAKQGIAMYCQALGGVLSLLPKQHLAP